MTYTKEELLTVHYLIGQLLRTHFTDWVKPQDRDEVRQELIEKILQKNLKHCESKGSADKWLYRLIKNHLTDTYRKKSRSIIQSMEDLSSLHMQEDEQDALKEELFVDRWNQYNQLLANEKAIDEQIVRLRHEKGMKYEQIARVLSISEGRLPMRYKRIKERLKRDYRPNRLLE